MDSNYPHIYRKKNLNLIKLKEHIINKFSNYKDKLNEKLYYDEILFILDEKCKNGKCDRDIVRELFDQNADANHKATLNRIIFKYVENLETSKLCLVRDEKTLQAHRQKVESLKGYKRAHVYIKLIQASIHARFSSTPIFSYKIQPTDIPPVTLVNSLNPVLNHEYTLQLHSNNFQIIFMQSNVPFYTWRWPGSQLDGEKKQIQAGQYKRNVYSEGVDFQMQIKFMPVGYNEQKIRLTKEIQQKKQQLTKQRKAFKNLCSFQPFIKKKKQKVQTHKERSIWWNITQKLIAFLPFLGKHVRNLYYFLLFSILLECLASTSWPMEFLDIVLFFGVIGILMDSNQTNIGLQLWASMLFCFLLILKSIWGTMTKIPNTKQFIIFIILAIIFKAIGIILMWITSVRKQQYEKQRQQHFYKFKSWNLFKKSKRKGRKLQDSIYKA